MEYRTLMNSLDELRAISMMDRIGLILDFSKVQIFRVGYQQMINFRQGLKSLLPSKKVNRIAIINPHQRSILNAVCSSASIVENDFLNSHYSCFTVEKQAEAYHLLH